MTCAGKLLCRAPEADGGQKQRSAGAAVLELARGPALLLPMATTSGGADARAEVAAPPNMVTRWRSVAGGRIDIVRVELVLDFIGTRSDGAVRVRLLTLVAALPSGPWGRAAPHLGAGGGGGCGEGGGGAGGGRRGKGRGRGIGDGDWGLRCWPISFSLSSRRREPFCLVPLPTWTSRGLALDAQLGGCLTPLHRQQCNIYVERGRR